MTTRLIFEWDERKRKANLRKHRIDFRDSSDVFAGHTVTTIDDRFDYGEPRLLTFGLLRGRVVAVTHTETPEVIRIISMRKASKREQAFFYETIQN